MILKQRKFLLSVGVAASMVAGAAFVRHQQDVRAVKPAEAPVVQMRQEVQAAPKVEAPVRLNVSLSLQEAIAYRAVTAVLAANGHDMLTARVTNPGSRPVRVEVPAGLILKSGQNRIAVIRHQVIEIGPRQTKLAKVRTGAVSAANTMGDALYELAADSDRRIEPVLTYAARHPEVSDEAIRTAMLAITDNLPLRDFAKFETTGSEVGSRFETKIFHVDTVDIINALALLRAIGIPTQKLALTVDPVLKVEAMIDPLAHAAALSYYLIPFEKEWVWWKSQLLEGDPATRHYALFGIARFYPEIAVQMMPKWAREDRMEPVFRNSAIQALAETRRSEALSVLQQLAYELGGDMTDLGRTAVTASRYLAKNIQEAPPAAAPRIRLRSGGIDLRPEATEPRGTMASLGLR
jgi:hypothetical protein